MTYDRDALIALRERVREAEGADREIDAALFVALLEPSWVTSDKDPGMVAASAKSFGAGGGKAQFIHGLCHPAPTYTASIDAALALVERVFPGCASRRDAWPLAPEKHRMFKCQLYEVDSAGWHTGDHFVVDGKSNYSEPLAILDALLTALIEREAS
jgi:hypothetical protein